ncbi:hypothetical protein NA56DRAFT_753227 [Hyaloscypha hepaticicola]|uniref:Uncharacterized protein n=1 Tax=Hyaloscypha hepaticicola TaxID=2082293 RepID=A0A2J6PQQ8_9HELO|nr:hypothetical protein NA56DRAFT_753227 [Hyaloscypha hepaticicola]
MVDCKTDGDWGVSVLRAAGLRGRLGWKGTEQVPGASGSASVRTQDGEELSSWPASSSLDPDARTDFDAEADAGEEQQRGIFPSSPLGAWGRAQERGSSSTQ